MKYDLEETITDAIMTATPAVIVEGRDDVQFYEQIATDSGKEITVYAVENFEEFDTGGCDSVITCIESLQNKINERPENINFVLGIIDKDARHFRNEIPNLLGLFVLHYYSIESHFVTRTNLKRLIADITYVSPGFIDGTTLDFIESGLVADYSDLFYISLEALKGACITDYTAIIGYKATSGKIAVHNSRSEYITEVYKKRAELDTFADQKNVALSDLKLVAKGKWLLHTFCFSVFGKIKDLSSVCSSGTIKSCQYCLCGRADQCLWKLRFGINYTHLVNTIWNYLDYDEIGYIQTKISSLG